MILNRLYYTIKPMLPWRVRTEMRRVRALRLRRLTSSVWPIDEEAGSAPPNWPGWPQNKRFAVVLTHDVEGTKGLSRVEELMQLEQRHGFRSSFNFVPEGEYVVSDELRDTLDRANFETGVHGLEHDGKLYNSKNQFVKKAAKIRHYLKAWNASGFRSPLMQHRLGWLHELGVEYDASTFDTDPFEPEPDGFKTIFPFWVPGPGGGGYVELPYTMVQDHTLFIVLQERNIDIWKQKVDWIAERGGMVLLNTHPDYMCFEGSCAANEFLVSHYRDLLTYITEKYEGSFWNALPREVARYYCRLLPRAERNTRQRVCMLTYSDYERDNRVRRYAESLASRGDYVEVISLGGRAGTGGQEPGSKGATGVKAYAIHRRVPDERNKWVYAWRLLRFVFISSIFLMRRQRRVHFDLVHVHNVPDFLAFAAWYPKIMGAKLILDIHDIVPEFFASKFKTSPGSPYIAALRTIEKISATFVDHVIISNDLWMMTLTSRSAPKEKCSVFVNQVDPAIFYPRDRSRNDGKVIVIFPGTFQWHQGLDIAIDAFERVRQKMPNAEFHLYGDGGSTEDSLREQARRLGIADAVIFKGCVPLDRIPEVIANADLGVVPKRSDSFGDEAYSTKIMEFMSQRIPVVCSRTKIDSFYFNDEVVRFFPSGDSEALAEAMIDVLNHKSIRDRMIARGNEYVRQHNWAKKRNEYFSLVDTLINDGLGLKSTFGDAGLELGSNPGTSSSQY